MPVPLPLSVLLLARDEEARLAALLPRLAFAREVVVVVDAATRDRTREVAASHGARVAERPLEDFGRQRQYGLEQCSQEWVLWVDADERLDEAAIHAITGVVESEAASRPAAYRLERRTWFLGRRIRYCGWRGERVLRLFRRTLSHFDSAPVHEQVTVRGTVGDLPGVMEHHSYESWRDCREKLFLYAERGAAKARAVGRRAAPWDVALRPPLRFFRMYVLQLGFLDGGHGVALCALAASQVLLKYLALWADPDGGRSG
jgi:glycosyltransferase involved in cell wall biosynthesis